MLKNHAVQEGLDDVLLLGREAGDGLQPAQGDLIEIEAKRLACAEEQIGAPSTPER